MFFRRLIEWLRSRKADTEAPRASSYWQRYEDTYVKPPDDIKLLIAQREAEWKPCGVAWRVLADLSDRWARAYSIDPPRTGRKTYAQRYAETSALPRAAARALLAQRQAQGKECGVLCRVLSEGA